jgi:hypothetical protein
VVGTVTRYNPDRVECEGCAWFSCLNGITSVSRIFVILNIMFSKSRKLHLLKTIATATDVKALVAVENIIKKNSKLNKKKTTIHDFVGIITHEESQIIRKAIKDTCERI